MKIILPKQELYNYYINQKKSSTEISKIFNCSRNTILRSLSMYNIPKRKFTNNRGLIKPLDKNKLYQLYMIDKLSTPKIAKILNATIDRIWRQLKYYGFGNFIRNSGEEKIIINKKILYDLYVNRHFSAEGIAKKYNCSDVTVLNWLRKYGFSDKIRIGYPKGTKNPKISGELSPTKRPEVKEKMSKNHYDCSGRNNPHFGKPASHGEKIEYKGIYMRSSWEYAFVLWLDKNNIKWEYEPKTFDLGDNTYTPDFYLSEFNLYIEIKGFWRDKAKEKFELFKQKYCGERIKLIEEYELTKEGII
jgi:hypothetical protein